MHALDGRTAVVTGGGRGIGRAVAQELAARGAHVVVVARSADEVREVAEHLHGRAIVADVADPAIAEQLAQLGQVDVLVANAGVVWPLGRVWQVDPDRWLDALSVNLAGAYRSIAAVLPGMVERGWGRIVAITSGAASGSGMPSANAYSVSKAGLEMLVRNLAAELPDTGVTANAVRPGTVDSTMQDYMRTLPRDQVGDDFYDRFHALHDEGRLIDPAVPARLVANLVCSNLNGEVVDVREERGRALLEE